MELVEVSRDLSSEVAGLEFSKPVEFVYNPLEYAWVPHREYIEKFGRGTKEILFLGMNPGPFGMAQTGVPFGEISFVRDWMGIAAAVKKPKKEHPKRPIEGFECKKSEVSGKRLWGWAENRFGKAEKFFNRFFVVNYCPLVFMEESGKNFTPDKLGSREKEKLFSVCDAALVKTLVLQKPRWILGVGAFAEERARQAVESAGLNVKVGRILHPSPASPIANRGWAQHAEKELAKLGIALF